MEVTDSPNEIDSKYVMDQLNNYNDKHRQRDGKNLAIFKKSNSGEIIAGLIGVSFLNWFQLDILWVKDALRGQGIGALLLNKAEEIAVERNCIGINLETYSYHNIGFYLKHGFVEFGVLNGYGDHSRHFLRKELVNIS